MSNINQNFKKEKCILMSLLAFFLIVMSIGFIADNSYAVNVNETNDDVGVEMGVDNTIETSHDGVENLKQNEQNEDVVGRGYGIYGNKISKIQYAINSLVGPGDVIYVGDDCTYVEGDVTILLNKTLTLTSAEAYYHHRSVFNGGNQISLFFIAENAKGSVLNDLEFINGVGHSGSAIKIGARDVVINNCSFLYNHCEEGGIVTTVDDPDLCDNLTISNCKFIKNTAYYSNYDRNSFASVLGIYSRNCRIINCTFEDNSVIGNNSAYGGAVYIGGNFTLSGSEVSGCVFKNNSVIAVNGLSYGGAICIDYDLNITKSTFINNKASYGGAVILKSIGRFMGCIFESNIANDSRGGAIYQDNGNLTFNIQNSTFKGNNADDGGAVFITGDDVIIFESNFINNSANKGGALFIKGSNAGIVNNTFINNSADYGGAIYINGLNTNINNSTFISNKALSCGLGGAIYTNGTLTTIESNVFKLNKARNGSAIYVDKFSKQQYLIKNIFTNNIAQIPNLIFSVKDILYNETEDVNLIICGGNNLYFDNGDLTISNAIYNDNSLDELEIDGVHPVYGAVNYDELYQDNLLYNASVTVILTNINGVVVSNKTYYSNRFGEIAFSYVNLTPSDYNLTLRIEDEHYEEMETSHNFTVYPQVDPEIEIFTNQTSYNLYDFMLITINITNNGPNNATNITAHNILPDGIIYQSDDSNNLYNGDNNCLNIDKLANGGNVLINIVAFVNRTGEIENKINVTVNELDVNLSNNFYSNPFIVNASSDLSISKTVNIKTPDYRTYIDWTIIVKNNGPDVAHNVILNDEIPEGLIVSNFDGNYDINSETWKIDLIESGSVVVLNMTTLVNTTGLVINGVSVSCDEYDYNLSNNYDEDFITLEPVSDLSVTTTLNVTTLNYLDLVKITLTVVNNGPDFSHDVVLVHKIPSSLTYISSTLKNDEGLYRLGNLSVGEKRIINITCKADLTGNYTDYVNITGREIDFNLSNNQYLKPIIINHTSDLEVNLFVNDSNPNYDSFVNWTIVVTNHGLNTAHNVNVVDLLPSSLYYINDTSNGKYDPKTGIWNIECIDVGEILSLTITSKINKTGVIFNSINVSSNEFDYNLDNNYDLKSIKVNLSSDLSITSKVDIINPNFNDYIKWTVTIYNNGPDNASFVKIKDILPEGLIYVNSTIEYWHNTLEVGTLNINQKMTVDIICKVNKTGKFINKVNISSSLYDFNLKNNDDSQSIFVNSSSNLEINAFINSSNAKYNDVINLTLLVKNNDPDIAHNISVTEFLPDLLSIIKVDDSFNLQNGVWNILSLNPNEEISLNLTCKIIKTGMLMNKVNVGGDEYDHDLNNNNHTLMINITKACDLSITISSNATSTNYNDYVKLTLTISNNGPDNASGVKIENTLPNLQVKINTTYNYENNILIDVGNLAVGESKTIDMICRVDVENYINTAKIKSNEYDYNLTNNIYVKSVIVNSSSDLEVISFINNSKPKYQDLINISILVKNNGKNNAHNVIIYDNLSDSLSYIGDDSKGDYDSKTGIWNVGNLDCGSEKILNIQCRVNKTGNIINHVNVTALEYDYNILNNNDTKSIFVNPAVDLSINSSFNVLNANYNDIVKLFINVKNNANDNATNIKINLTLPNSLSYINSTYPYQNGIISIGDLNQHMEKSFEINLKVISTGNYDVFANISLKEFDYNLENNHAQTSIIINPVADLEINALANITSPNLGDSINWTVTIKNNGINTAHNITITNLISQSLIPINFTTYNKIDSLNAGDEIVYNIITKVNKTGLIESKFNVSANEWDYNLDNNNKNISFNSNPACDLLITGFINDSNVFYGDLVKISLNVSNIGFDEAQNVKINLKVPDSLIYQSSSLPIINNSINIGYLAIGENTIINIVYKVNSTNNEIYLFDITSQTFDCNLVNNGANISINVDPASDLEVMLSVDGDNYNYLDFVNWTIVVHNNGFNKAFNVSVTCLLPDSLLLVDFESGVLNVGDLDVGEEVVLTVKSQVIKTGVIMCSVNVTSDTFDFDLVNNNYSRLINVNSTCDLSISASFNSTNLNYGDLVKLTLNITNNGLNDATNIKIINTVIDSLLYQSSTLPYLNNTINIVKLNINDSLSVDIVYKVNNTVSGVFSTKISSDNYDFNKSNNDDSVFLNINPTCDLELTLIINNTNLYYNDLVNLCVIVKNNGLNVANNIKVNNLISNSFKYENCDLINQFNPESGIWTINHLNAGDETKLNLEFKLNNTGIIDLNINVTSDEFDYNLINNYVVKLIVVNATSDLSIFMDINDYNPNYRDIVKLSFVVLNNGLNDAHDVKIHEILPTSLIYHSSTIPFIDNTFNIGYIPVGAEISINMLCEVNSTGYYQNSVYITCYEFDYNQSNNNANITFNVNQASDLEISLLVNNTNPNFNDFINLVVNVKNIGICDAQNIVVNYNVPDSLICLNDESSEVIIPNLNVGEEYNLNIMCQIVKTGNILSSVNVVCQNFDYNLTNNYDSILINVNKSSDLEIIASFNSTNLNYGDLVKLTLTITNNGPDNASNINIVNNLPIFFNSTNYNISINKIKYGEVIVLEKTFKINGTGSYIYSVGANGVEFDYNLENNHFNQTLFVNKSSDLSVDIQINNITPNYHDIVNISIIVKNNGYDVAHDVVVNLTKDDSLICVDDQFLGGTCIWRFDKVDVGERLLLNIPCMVNKTGTLTNKVNIIASEFDYNSSNNQDVKSIYIKPASDLAITVKSNNTNVNYMDLVKLTFTIINNGPDNATDIKINEILPIGFEIINSTNKNISELAVNQKIVFDIICRVVENGNNINFVNVSAKQFDYNLDNNYDVKSFMVNKSADLAINVIVNNTNPNYKDLIKLTLVISNNGPDEVDDVEIVNILPDSFILLNSTPNYQNIKFIKSNEKRSIDLIYKINTTGNFTNQVSITSKYYDYNILNNKINTTINVNHASDLEIIRLMDQVNSNYGELVNWTIIIKNNGPNTAHNISINNLIPDDVTPVIFTSSQELGELWDIYSLEVGEEVRFNITALMDSTGLISNTVSVYASEFDYNLENNQNSGLISVNSSADLSVNQKFNNTNPNYQDNVKLTLTIVNNGPNKAYNIKINNIIPDGFNLINQTHDLNNIGDLEVNQKITINLTYKINTVGEHTFQTNISCDEYDYNLKNNYNSISLNINQSADLEIIELVNISNPKIGDIINWTIVVKNNGPSQAHDVVVKNMLPNSLIYIQKSQNSDFNPQTGIWNIKTINSNSQISLNITTKVNKTGSITNIVNVSCLEFDYNLSNNKVNKTIVVGSSIDLNIDLKVNNSNPKYGELVEWIITVTNDGVINATDVKVRNLLPQGLILVNTTSSNGKYEDNIWIIDKLSDEYETLKIITKVNKTGKISNLVEVLANEFDINMQNNNVVQYINVEKVIDITLNIQINNSNPYMGDKVLLTVEISNNGLDNADNVEVEGILPDKLKIISFDLTKGNYLNGIWSINSLNVGDVEKLNISCYINESGSFNVNFNTNISDVSCEINVLPTVDIVVEQYFNNTNPNYGDLVKWTIITSNNGFDRATELQIQKIVPQGLKVINTTITKGTYNDDMWFGCCLVSGETQKLESVCRVEKTGIIICNVNISTVKHDTNLTNNYATTFLNVSKAADIQVKSYINSTNPHYNEIILLTINVTNNGVDSASDVRVHEILPDSLEIISNNLLKSDNEDEWNIPLLGVGESQTFSIICKITDVGEISNIAYANSSEYDFDKLNNLDRLNIKSIPLADISVEQYVSNPNPNYGDLVNLTLKLSNKGPNDVSNLTVYNIVSDNLQVVQSSDNLNYVGGNWYVDELKNEELKQLDLICRVISTTTSQSSPQISGSYYDSNKSNNYAGDNIAVKPASDLAISIKTSKNHYNIGDIVEYIITVYNNGPDVANSVKIHEFLDKSLSVKSVKESKGQFFKSSGIWEINQLNNGESAKLVIKAYINNSGTFKINATVSGDNFDYNFANNFDSNIIYVDNKTENGEKLPTLSKNNSNHESIKTSKYVLGILEKQKTGNPFLMLGLSLMFIFVSINERLFKKK